MFMINTTSYFLLIQYQYFIYCFSLVLLIWLLRYRRGLLKASAIRMYFVFFFFGWNFPFFVSVPPLQLSRQDKDGILYQQKTYLEDNIFICFILDSWNLILALAEQECFFAQMWILFLITQISCLGKDWVHQVNT